MSDDLLPVSSRPPAVPTPACAGCSLEPLCLPRLCAGPSARAALRRLIPEAP